MNKILKFLEIINQLCSVFFIENFAKIKQLLSRNRKLNLGIHADANTDKLIRISTETDLNLKNKVNNKLSLNNKNIKLTALTLVVTILVIATFLILKSKQQTQRIATSTQLSEWNNNLENASKSFNNLDYDKAYTLDSNALAQAENNGAELHKFSSQELLGRIYNAKASYLKAAETYKAIFTSLNVLPGSESSAEMATTIVKSLIGLGLLNQNLALYQQAIASFQLAATVSKNKFGGDSVMHEMSQAYLADT